MQNTSKILLRKQIKSLIRELSPENRMTQSKLITQKVLAHPAYQTSKRISIYLSTDYEVNTIDILRKMFQDQKQVFVPTYSCNDMKMLRIFDFEDYEALPLTKWNIKQPSPGDVARENPMLTGPLDLILIPGVAFSMVGGRCGHGMGYYDKYLHKYFQTYDKKINRTHLIGLAFREQIVDDENLPLDPLDFPLDTVLTSDDNF